MWCIIRASSSPFCRTTSSAITKTCTRSVDAISIRRPSEDHLILFSPRPEPPSGSTTIPFEPVMGSSSECAKFQSPRVPLLEAVAIKEGCAGDLYEDVVSLKRRQNKG